MVRQTVALIDYGSGNLHSALKALERAAREFDLNADVVLTADPAIVSRASRIVLPGVGAFRDCRDGLAAIDDMWRTIDEAVLRNGRPFLGICVGMQLMATRGLEFGETEGFGWIGGDVGPIRPADEKLKIPHMGWNTLSSLIEHPVLAGIPTGPDGLHAYFVHSYHLQAADPAVVIATSDYGGPITAVVARATAVGTQFHPEKSQELGLRLLANFLRWSP